MMSRNRHLLNVLTGLHWFDSAFRGGGLLVILFAFGFFVPWLWPIALIAGGVLTLWRERLEEKLRNEEDK